MDAWWMCEVPYPHVPKAVLDAADPVRASLPNRYCDPRISADLFEEVIDEYLLCDEMGLNVCATEHHAGINSLVGSNPMLVAILARQTRKARILSLGTLISLRREPVRIAEEYATADVISRGRLELGFVKSGGTEMASANANPVNNIERYWEAIDLVAKALTRQDGPFSWEGKHFTHRHVNIWPRPWQQKLRLWAATGDPHTAAEVGRRGMVHTLVLRGPEGTRRARRPACRPPRSTTSPTRPSSRSAIPRRKAGGSAPSSCGSSTPASSRRRSTPSSCPAPRRPMSRARLGGPGRRPARMGPDAWPRRRKTPASSSRPRPSRRWRKASCSPAIPTASTRRSSSFTTTSAASVTSP